MRPPSLAVTLAVLSLAPGAPALRAAEPAAPPAPAAGAAAASGPAPEAAAARPAPARSKAALVEGFEPSPQDLPGAAPKAIFTLSVPDPATIAPETRSAEQAAWRAYYDYKVRGLRHRGEVYDWQLASQKAIFVVVLFLVIAGIYFSWLQFRASLPQRPSAAASAGAADAPAAPVEAAVAAAITEISAGREGIKVSSPVLGVIILVLSLLFFYLYLVYVYPISEMF